jgi:hypothetical protein
MLASVADVVVAAGAHSDQLALFGIAPPTAFKIGAAARIFDVRAHAKILARVAVARKLGGGRDRCGRGGARLRGGGGGEAVSSLGVRLLANLFELVRRHIFSSKPVSLFGLPSFELQWLQAKQTRFSQARSNKARGARNRTQQDNQNRPHCSRRV